MANRTLAPKSTQLQAPDLKLFTQFCKRVYCPEKTGGGLRKRALRLAVNRRHQAFDNAKYCLSEDDFRFATIGGETIRIKNMEAKPCSVVDELTRQSRVLSVAFGSSLRDNSFASGIL